MSGKTSDKVDITQSLPALSERELREVRARIDFLLKGGRKATNGNGAGEEDPVDMVLAVIHQLCWDHGLESRPLAALRGSHGYPAFAEKVPLLLASLGAKGFNTLELRTLLKLGLGLTLEQLADMGVPLSASVLMNHVHRLPGVLDSHFPGYREAGMLKLVVRSNA